MKAKQPRRFEAKKHKQGYASPKWQDLHELASSIFKDQGIASEPGTHSKDIE